MPKAIHCLNLYDADDDDDDDDKESSLWNYIQIKTNKKSFLYA
jgi:hypothetical protein